MEVLAESLSAESTNPEAAVEVMEQVMEGMTMMKVLYGILLLLVCIAVIKVVMTLVDRTMKRLRVEPTVHKFARASLKVLLWLGTAVVMAGYLGLPVNSIVALVGVVGVALSLSLQGSLSNLAGGITVMVTRPFAVGDYVKAGDVEGTVSEIGLVYTKLKTVDNKVIYIPNGEVSGEIITNYSAQDKRRVSLTFSVSYDDDPERVKTVMRQVVNAHPLVKDDPAPPFIRTTELGASGVGYTLRVWCDTQDYWDLYYDLLEQVRAAFDAAGIDLTYNNLNVYLRQGDGLSGSDMDGEE